MAKKRVQKTSPQIGGGMGFFKDLFAEMIRKIIAEFLKNLGGGGTPFGAVGAPQNQAQVDAAVQKTVDDLTK